MSGPVLPALLGRFEWHDLPFVRAWENPTISEILFHRPCNHQVKTMD